MDLLLPGIGLLFWTLLAFAAVFFILRKVCMEDHH